MAEGKEEQQRSPFEQIPVDLLENTDLTESELVFYVLIVRLSSQKGYCYATNEYIGNLRGKNWRTAQRVIESLKKKNYIRVEVSDKYKRKVFPLRYVKTDVGGTSILSWGYDITDAGGTSDLTKRYVKNDVKNNTKNNTKRISICANDDLRTSTPTNSKRKTKEAEARAEAEVLFDEKFWPAYPYHENSKGKLEKPDKKRAKAAFLRVKNIKQAFPFIMQALERWAGTIDYSKGDGKYTPYAATWLNGERWKDEVKEQPPAGASSSSWGGRSAAGEISEAEQRARDEAARRAAGFDD